MHVLEGQVARVTMFFFIVTPNIFGSLEHNMLCLAFWVGPRSFEKLAYSWPRRRGSSITPLWKRHISQYDSVLILVPTHRQTDNKTYEN